MHKDQTCESTELNRQFDATQIMKSFCTFRFPMPGDETAYIVCVADNPRIHYCGDNSLFDPQTLSCLNYQVISLRSHCNANVNLFRSHCSPST